MCGITGFIGNGGKNDLLGMMSQIQYRGPDDEGVYIDGPVHLGHKRLSIIDLTPNGRQPMSNEDGTIWLISNGEIYNFPELKDDLLRKGHKFKSQTDSEVIIHLYEDIGMDICKKLNGMFAFAIWDKKINKLFLARDRMGQKPVYYSLLNNAFIFGSEPAAILKHPSSAKKLNLKAAIKYFFYEHIPTPDCIWENISQLAPASYLSYDPLYRKCEIEKYWRIKFLPRITACEDDLPYMLSEKIFSSVKRHLISDVPTGVYLSGGLDSSTIAYYSQKALKGNLRTFTIAFQEDTFGEQFTARQTASLLKTEHHEIDFNSGDFLKTALEILPKLDAPFADSSLIPAYFLNKTARSNIKVALGGEGGDEIFVGYPIYMAHEILAFIKTIPPLLRKRFLNPAINKIKTSYKNETWTYRIKKFIEAEDYYNNPFYCQQIWLGAFGPAYLKKLFSKDLYALIDNTDIFENVDIYRQDADKNEDIMDGLMRQTQHNYLMDTGLVKADRASMYNSLEMRAPLLDNDLVEFVNRIPFKYKYNRGRTKILLRNLMKNKIPDDIISGKKKGFTPPIAEWFVSKFQKELHEYIFAEDALLDTNYIKRLWREHFSKKQNHRKLLWTLFAWKLWSSKNLGSIKSSMVKESQST